MTNDLLKRIKTLNEFNFYLDYTIYLFDDMITHFIKYRIRGSCEIDNVYKKLLQFYSYNDIKIFMIVIHTFLTQYDRHNDNIHDIYENAKISYDKKKNRCINRVIYGIYIEININKCRYPIRYVITDFKNRLVKLRDYITNYLYSIDKLINY